MFSQMGTFHRTQPTQAPCCVPSLPLSCSPDSAVSWRRCLVSQPRLSGQFTAAVRKLAGSVSSHSSKLKSDLISAIPLRAGDLVREERKGLLGPDGESALLSKLKHVNP